MVEIPSHPSEEARARNTCTQANTETDRQLFVVFAMKSIKYVGQVLLVAVRWGWS